jgi:peptide/nickel transport system permease protein
MLRFILRRIAGLLFVVVGVSIFTFAISQLVPVDPAATALGPKAREEQIQAYRHELGLDLPVWQQYTNYVGRLLQGNLGASIRTRRPVLDDLVDFFPATFELSLAALVVSLCFGIPLGIIAALRRNNWADALARLIALAGGSMPIFYVGLLGLGLFYRTLRWLPGGGRIDTTLRAPESITGLFTIDALLTSNWPILQNALWHLILPALTLGYFSTAVLLRITRSAMLEALSQDYVRTARAKGLAERLIVLRHIFKNALPPVLTTIGITFGSLLSGAVLTETIFGWPGLGRYATTSVNNLDLPAVMGVTLLAALIYPLINTLIDIGYSVVDPRVRVE